MEELIGNYLETVSKTTVTQVARERSDWSRTSGTAEQRRIAAILDLLRWKRLEKDWRGTRWWGKS